MAIPPLTKTEATMLMTFLNADDPRLLPETVEVPDNLVPEMRNVAYICDDPGAYIDTYPDDWLVLNGVD